MFIDKECASLLQQGRLRSELQYRARIFSLSNRQAFLDYLDALSAGATTEVIGWSDELYGAA